jgi:inorganic pyrophosphatase
MRVTVETPRWSFTKCRIEGGRLVREFASPLPSIFNYGFVAGTVAADGSGEDAIVLGARLDAGEAVDVVRVGTVRFVDDGVRDDKAVTSSDGKISQSDRAAVWAFFMFYALFKTVRCLLKEGRLGRFRFGGFVPG